MKPVKRVKEWLEKEKFERTPIEPEEAIAAVIGEEWLRYLSTLANNLGAPLEEVVATSILFYPRTATTADPDSVIDNVLFATKAAGAFLALLRKMRELGKIVPCRAKFYALADELSDIYIILEFDKTGVEAKMVRNTGATVRRVRISYPTFKEVGIELPENIERDDSLLDVEYEYGDLVDIELL